MTSPRKQQFQNLQAALANNFFFQPWVIVSLVVAGYCLVTLITHSWDPFAFILIGKQFDPVHGVLDAGYDGQFAYQIALNPAGAAEFLDVPAYRYQRIFYPMLARFLALGIPSVIPWTLILINVLSIPLGTLATEKILQDNSKSRWYALTYGLFSGLLLSLRLDLTEPLAFMLAQWGVLLFSRKRFGWSGLLFSLAILTRELSLLFAVACGLSLFFENQKIKSILWGLFVLLPFTLWQLFLRVWLGNWGIGSGGAFASAFEPVPYRGWWGYHTSETLIFVFFSIFVLIVALIPATAAIGVGVRDIFMRRLGLGVWILLLNGLIFPFLPTSNVLNPPGLLRITVGLVAAVVDYGALESSNRALRFSVLWLVLLLFGEGFIAVY